MNVGALQRAGAWACPSLPSFSLKCSLSAKLLWSPACLPHVSVLSSPAAVFKETVTDFGCCCHRHGKDAIRTSAQPQLQPDGFWWTVSGKKKKSCFFLLCKLWLRSNKDKFVCFFFFQKWSNSDCYLKNGAIEGLQSYPVHYGDFWLLVFAMISGGQRLATRRLVKINSMGLQCPL